MTMWTEQPMAHELIWQGARKPRKPTDSMGMVTGISVGVGATALVAPPTGGLARAPAVGVAEGTQLTVGQIGPKPDPTVSKVGRAKLRRG
jgi:Fe2+ transport system protein FeoA